MHRIWEALYLGVIPIVQTSALDELLEDLPVLIVRDFEDVTETLLSETYTKCQTDKPSKGASRLLRQFWYTRIEHERRKALDHLGLEEMSPRVRCWGR